MANTVDKVLAVAEAEVGYLEKSAAAYKKNPQVLYEKTAGAGSDNYTKYGREMHDIYPAVMDFPAAWCDCFVDWCFYQAYGVATAKSLLAGNFDDYTVASAQMYKNKGAYYKTPKVGDQIFFNNGTRICHTGIVYKVDAQKVYTIEGNTSGGSTLVANGGGVAKKSYALNYARIDGYGRPKYDVEEAPAPKPFKKVSDAKCFDRMVGGAYEPTTDLNMRYGPGSSYDIVKVIPAGARLINYGYYSLNGTTWWLYVVDAVTGLTGYCSKKCLKKL